MRNCRHNRAGFTMMEITFSMLLLVLGLAAALSGWLYVVRGERQNSLQAELDIDVRSAMEWIKSDLRLSAMDHVFYYPDGPGPFTGISFPMAWDDDGDGYVELNANNKIIWDETVIYHVWEATPNQLRRTSFRPRNNSLSDDQRQDQLNSVVENGNGDFTYNLANASTMAVFENLFHWIIRPKGAIFDAYAPALERVPTALGSVLLDAGAHTFTFSVVGKNDSASDYKIGLDSLVGSASGLDREAEAQLPATQAVGATPVATYMAAGSWSGNYQLTFPAGGAGDYFELTMNNDRWEETNFKQGVGTLTEDTVVWWLPLNDPMDFAVRLAGGYGDTNWWAIDQMGSQAIYNDEMAANKSGPYDMLKGCAVRTLIKGGNMDGGDWIDHDGGNCKFRFDSGNGDLRIQAAYVAECADHLNPSPEAAANGVQLLFGGSPQTTISSWGGEWADPATPFPIDRDKSYLVTILLDNIGNSGTPEYWPGIYTNSPHCYVIEATNVPTAVDCAAASWAGKPYVSVNQLMIVKFMKTTYATNGYYYSRVVDTHMENPNYTALSWNSTEPAGTYVDVDLRAGSTNDLSAESWLAGVGGLSGRYLQFRANLKSNNNPDFDLCETPELHDVTIEWDGPERIVDIGGLVTTGPDYGVFAVTVDGKQLVGGIQIELEIYEQLVGLGGNTKMVTSSMSAEVEPRNTGK